MRYFYKKGKLYEIKDKPPELRKKGSGRFKTLFWIIILILVIYGGRHIFSHHRSDRLIENTHYKYENSTNNLLVEPDENICEKVNDYNTPEDEIIKIYDTYLGHFILKVGNKEHYGLRHILARHTNYCFPNYNKARTLFDDDITVKEIVNDINYFLHHCVEVYMQKKNPYDENRQVCLGYIQHNGYLIRCLLVYKIGYEELSIITFYPYTKEAELERYREIIRRNSYYYTNFD